MNGFFNKKEPIEYIVEFNIYYQRHRKRMEINIIRDKTLLFLLPPSCMVASIGNIVNISSFSTNLFNISTMDLNNNSTNPTMFSMNSIGMDIQAGQGPVPDSAIRGRNLSPSVNLSRESSLASSGCSIPYHDRMDINVDFPSSRKVSNLELSYETEQEKAQRVGMAANQQDNTRPLHVHNEAPPTYSQHKKEVINIQLSYDLQAPTKPDLWNGFFHPIFLHGSIEHFASDFKSIQVSLDFLAKYIRNKQVNGNMINDLADFDGMGDAIWNFISSVYNAKWDTFYTDNKANTLRAKVSSKFTPRTIPQHNGNKKDIAKSVPVTINKVLPSPPLLAKTRKEINIIFKYFHPKKSSVENTAKGNNTSPRNQTY